MKTIRYTSVLLTVTVFLNLFAGTGCIQHDDPLRFPVDDYTVETIIVSTSAGEKEVTFLSYMHIPYVSDPVDSDYQSMNVFVPVSIDGADIDASGAPLFFRIGVGGYMSVNNAASVSGFPARGGADVSALALAAGYVVVAPGCRGRDNVADDGTYYGKAPAAIVDLKAAVRYIRHNDNVMPGNADYIVSCGCSAGGALSALLGASGNSPLYDAYLEETGAAESDDDIFASVCYSPITDLEHADGAYEWMYGNIPARSGPVDSMLSAQLKEQFVLYQESLKLQGKDGFGIISAANYPEYLMRYYLVPSAESYLNTLPEDERNRYLSENPWINYNNQMPSFAFDDYVAHVGRMKGLPAFDDFEMRQPEPQLFGNRTTDARHFTEFSLRLASGDENATLDAETVTLVNMMNALYFTSGNTSGCAGYWWLRNGTSDNHTSQTVMVNLATRLENINKKVNASLFWDGGHCADYDPEGMIQWIGEITGYKSTADMTAR